MKNLNYKSFNIATLVTNERKKHVLKLEDVGLGIGVSPSYIFRIENDLVTPSQKIITRLINYFELGEEHLLQYLQTADNTPTITSIRTTSKSHLRLLK